MGASGPPRRSVSSSSCSSQRTFACSRSTRSCKEGWSVLQDLRSRSSSSHSRASSHRVRTTSQAASELKPRTPNPCTTSEVHHAVVAKGCATAAHTATRTDTVKAPPRMCLKPHPSRRAHARRTSATALTRTSGTSAAPIARAA
jgi:hypothetical protein